MAFFKWILNLISLLRPVHWCLMVLEGSGPSIWIGDKCHREFTAVAMEGAVLITSLSKRWGHQTETVLLMGLLPRNLCRYSSERQSGEMSLQQRRVSECQGTDRRALCLMKCLARCDRVYYGSDVSEDRTASIIRIGRYVPDDTTSHLKKDTGLCSAFERWIGTSTWAEWNTEFGEKILKWVLGRVNVKVELFL
jgi:hypothetical protein